MSAEASRLSNFELLRILAIIMILNSHAFLGKEVITIDTLSIGDVFNYLWKSVCVGGACLFVLISGYFGIKWKFKGFASLIYQTYFFVLFIYIILLATKVISFNLMDFAYRLNCISSAYWFITQYFLLMIIAPMLNSFVEKTSKYQLLFIVISYHLVEFYFCHTGGFGFNGGGSVLSFIGIYLLGRYLKLHYSNRKVSTTRKKSFYLCLTIIAILILVLAEKIFFHLTGSEFRLIGGVLANPLVILKSLLIFLIIKEFEFKSSIVNKLSTVAFPIYLVHMHPDVKKYFYSAMGDLYNNSFLYHVVALFVIFSIVILVSFLIDSIRKYTFEKLYPILSKRYECIKLQMERKLDADM